MDIRAIAFDVNGTLVDIWTEDGMEQAFRSIGHLLTYQGIDVRRHDLRELYFRGMERQKALSVEAHPEFDAVALWRHIIDEHQTDFTKGLPAAKRDQLPLFLAEMYRGITRRRLHCYPHVRQVLDVLRERFPLAIVTDAQTPYARAELHKVGLLDYFDPVVVSGDYGYRKPDGRLFGVALAGLHVDAPHALYVGNDLYRDVQGAREAGMKTVLFAPDEATVEPSEDGPDYVITDHRQLLALLGLGSAG